MEEKILLEYSEELKKWALKKLREEYESTRKSISQLLGKSVAEKVLADLTFEAFVKYQLSSMEILERIKERQE
jgi:hypothetical protein